MIVACPNHLVKQWVDEVKNRAPGLKVIYIPTVVQMRKLTQSDYLEAGSINVHITFYF